MTDELRNKEIIEALGALRQACNRVSSLWDHTGTNMIDGYPPCLPSWDEFELQLSNWYHVQRLQRMSATKGGGSDESNT